MLEDKGSDDDMGTFLDLTSDEEMQNCFRELRVATSNERLRECVCVVCARKMGVEMGEESSLLEESSV